MRGSGQSRHDGVRCRQLYLVSGQLTYEVSMCNTCWHVVSFLSPQRVRLTPFASTICVTRYAYSYAGTGYSNPDAPTQIANGVSTTTFSYDADGNVTQETVDGTTTTYVWDYANRLTALGFGGAT